MNDLTAITHVQWNGYWDADQTIITLRRTNAEEATYTILDTKHYRELIETAANGQCAAKALSELKEIFTLIFDKCPEAADIYLKARVGWEKKSA